MVEISTNNKLLFILINYFNESEVSYFIQNELNKQSFKEIEIIIVDNGSKNSEILENLLKNNTNIHLYKPHKNTGYFGGASYGLEKYLVEFPELPKAVIISNSDIKFDGVDFIFKLSGKITENNFDILGPKIISGLTKQNQNPYIKNPISFAKIKTLKFLSSGFLLYNAFLLYYYLKQKIKSLSESNLKNITSEPEKVYGIHGSFMVFKRSFFEKGGNLNYGSLLFGEEIFIAELAKKLKLITIYMPDLTLIHNEHATTGIFKSVKAVKLLHDSYKHLLATYNFEK